MCTSISFCDRGLYGRNLDLEYHFGEQVVITPRDYPFSFHHRDPLTRHFAMIGMASVAQDTPLYAEAANEKGLYMAGLYFPGNARYFEQPDPDLMNLAPYELIPLVLGSCSTAAEARSLLQKVRLAAIPFAPGYPLAALHWQVAGAGRQLYPGAHGGWFAFLRRCGWRSDQQSAVPPPADEPEQLPRSVRPHTGEHFCPRSGPFGLRAGVGRVGAARRRLPHVPVC